MTEQDLRELLARPVEVPPEVEARLAAACAQAGHSAGKKRPRRGLRTLVVAACLTAALCVGAAAGYTVVREEKFPDLDAAVEAMFGNQGRDSVEATVEYDETGGMSLNLPNQERVPVDAAQAEALVGEYLPGTGYVWQVGDYTLTVESYLLDEHTGTGRVYFTLERPGGVEGLQITPEDGEAWADGSGISLNFCAGGADGTWTPMSGRFYADQNRSTPEKLYLTAALGAASGWKAEDGLHIRFHDLRRNRDSERDVSLVAEMELPGADSLPAVTAVNPKTGGTAACFSAIGMLVDTSYLEDGDSVRYVALEYADGSTYVVQDDAGNVDNAEHGLYNMDGTQLRLCFNRLVDPAQVVSVAVDGAVCERLVARLGPGAPAAIERHVADEAAPDFCAILRTWGENDVLYANALERVRALSVTGARGRGVALLVLYLACACLGDPARAVRIVRDFAEGSLGCALRTQAADIGAAPAVREPRTALALVRVADGRIMGGIHPLRADAVGTVIGSLAPDPGAIVDVAPDVSGRHLRIWCEGDRWLVEGLDSTFGTTLTPGDGGPERVVEPPSASRGPAWVPTTSEILPGDTLRLASVTEFLVLEVSG